jgi:2',3'-cyclic-nucleotide 2'-phosphodiesterase/3'-nucleotidase
MPILALLAGLVLAPPDTVRIVLVATADVHGYVTDWDYLNNAPWSGGLARAATAIDSLRQRYPDQVVLVDAGDVLAGSPLAAYYGAEAARDPHPVIEAMNLLGYDAATPGERDFDFGAERFNRAIAGATFPWVSGNLRALPADTLALAPYVVITRGGVRIAVTGFTTPAAMIGNGGRLRGRYRVNRIEPSLEPVMREMRQDADLVVALAHTGLAGPSSYDTTGVGGEHVAGRLAAGTARPDIVVVGHSHQQLIDSVIGGVHFVQPRAEAAGLAILHVTLVPQAGRLVPVRVRGERLALRDVRSSARVQRRLAEPHGAVLKWVSTPVGEVDRRVSAASARVEDTPLMRFMHQAIRRATGATLSGVPVYDPRAGFDAGDVTLGELFRLYPFEHTLRVVRVSGEELKAYLEQSARHFFVDSTGRVFTNRFAPGDRYDLVGGASYVIDLSARPGSRVTRLAVGGRPVLPADTLTLAVSDSRHQGQGGFAMLTGAPVVSDPGITVRQALVAAFSRARALRVTDYEGRDWALAPDTLARRARALYVRDQVASPVVDSAPGPSPAIALPLARTRAEQRAADSLARERERADSIAAVVVATLRLPAEAVQGGGLARLLADAYRNDRRADLAVVLSTEATERLPARGLTAAEIGAAAAGDATLLTLRMSGDDISGLLENAVAQDRPCCELSGIQVRYDPKGKPGSRVRGIRLIATGKSLEPKRDYLVALSSALIQGDSLPLAATDCRPGKGCRNPAALSRWKVERDTRRPAEVLLEYLRHLPQPVTPPDDRRLIPTR